MNAHLLILASASPRREALLRQMGLQFRVVPTAIGELHHEDFTARELCRVNAYRKARIAAKQYPDALVLAADTLVYRGTELFGKPATLAEARQMLSRLQGTTHQVVTALCLMHLRQHRQKIVSDETAVTFKKLSAADIRQYFARVNPLDKAGAYAIQEHGEMIIERIVGSYSNVVGLPVECLALALAEWGEEWSLKPALVAAAARSQSPASGPPSRRPSK